MTIDRMELADCGSPERLLIKIFKQNPNLPIPVPVDSLAHEAGITDFRELDTDSFEGGLITLAEKAEGIILVRRGMPAPRRRFTVSHELGHLLIPAHAVPAGGFHCTTADMREARTDNQHRRQEAEANRFAAGLLLPAPHFRKDLEKLKSPDLQHVFDLRKRYDASIEATARRYSEMSS